MENISNELVENKSGAVTGLSQVIMAKIYRGPRQMVYSYFEVIELIKVATLSKRERETVLNSKIVKENREDGYMKCKFDTVFYERYSSDVALQGLLIAIQLSTGLALFLNCKREDEKRFKNFYPAIIHAAVRTETKIEIIDGGQENLNIFAANEIEKVGALINTLFIKNSVNLCRIIAKAKKVELLELTPYNNIEIKSVIETYSEFPHLKVLHYIERLGIKTQYSNHEILGAIIGRSQVEEFLISVSHSETDLLKLLAKQTQLKKVELTVISDVEVLLTSLSKSVQNLIFKLNAMNSTDIEQKLVLILNSQIQLIEVNENQGFDKTGFEEILNKYLDDNQLTEGNRTRYFLGWDFLISVNNKILNLLRNFESNSDAEISFDNEDEISDFENDKDHENNSN